MYRTRPFAALLALASLALLAVPASSAWLTHTSLHWDALGQGGGVKVTSHYREYVGHPIVEQRFRLDVDGAPPSIPVEVELNGRHVQTVNTDVFGHCSLRVDRLRSPAVTVKGRPAQNRRIDAGDVVRVYNPAAGVDASATFTFTGVFAD